MVEGAERLDLVVEERAKETGILRGVGSSGLGGRRVLFCREGDGEEAGGVGVSRATLSWRVGWGDDEEQGRSWPYIIISVVSGPSAVIIVDYG